MLVPGVLECSHILDVDNRFYPIHVKKAHLSEVKLTHTRFSPKSPRFCEHDPDNKLHLCLKFCVLFQVDMPAETALDLSMFPNPESVLKLLKLYDFTVTELVTGHLRLTGSFLKLKLLRNELVQLQGHERQSHSRAPSALHNGSTSTYDMERDSLEPRSVSLSISRNADKMDAVSRHQLLDSAPLLSSSYRHSASGGSPRSLQNSHSSYAKRNASSPTGELLALRQNPLADAASSLSANSPSSLTMLHHTSALYRDSPLGGSPRSLHGSHYSSIGSTSHTIVDTMQHHTSHRDSASGVPLRRHQSFSGDPCATSSHSSPSSSIEGMARFPVDTDCLNFILTQKQDVVQMIEACYGTKMVVTDNAGFTMVTYLGKNSEEAKANLLDIMKKLSPSLRTQEIQLSKYDRGEQKQILERIQRNKDLGVMITHNDDVVKLVGSSNASFEMKQKILGHSDDPHRGRAMERNSKPRRSTSLPRQYKMADHVRVTAHENQASVANKYSPSHYHEESDERIAPQIRRGPEQTPNKNFQWTASNLESREKNRTTREQEKHQGVDLVSPSREKKSTKQQSTDLRRLHDLNHKLNDFKLRFLHKKK